MLDSPFLFTHKYDIDTLIDALCTAPHEGVFLDTQTGNIGPVKPENSKHAFKLEPLPASIFAELKNHPLLAKTESATQARILEILANINDIAVLPSHFEHGLAGGWLRERMKDYALEWLDGNDLIPPSMRHVPRQNRTLNTLDKPKVNIV